MDRVLDGNAAVRQALDSIEEKVRDLIPLADGQASGLQIGRLTRKHLRESLTYFLASRDSRHLLPYDRLGTGTSNVLVLALLGAISEARQNVIFAMEEPEIALPPHTQRVIVQRLRDQSAQALVTSHSPYVAECFIPDDIVVLRRADDGAVESAIVTAGSGVREKTLRRDFRTRFAEGMLARSVMLVEGTTELWALPGAVDVLAAVDGSAFRALELDGMVILAADGAGEIPKLAEYFRDLGIPVHVFCDQVEEAEEQAIVGTADSVFQHSHKGFEPLMATQLPVETLRRIVRDCETWPDYPHNVAPLADNDEDDDWRSRCEKLLKMRKGEGWAQRFLDRCSPEEIPGELVACIAHMRREIGHSPLPRDDPLAEVFLHADPDAVEPDASADGTGGESEGMETEHHSDLE